MSNVINVNLVQETNVLNNISKTQKQSETNFKDTVSQADRVNAVKEKIKKELPEVYLHVVDYKKIYGFNSYSYPVDKIYQENLTLKDFNRFPRIKNTALDSQELISSINRCFGKKAVLIHPDTLDKMSKDPDYFDKIISQVKGLTNQVGNCQMSHPDIMTTSVVVGVDKDGNVQEQWSTAERISMSESKTRIRIGKSKRDIQRKRLEEYLEKMRYQRKLTSRSIMELQISQKENITRIQKANLLKSNPYDLSLYSV